MVKKDASDLIDKSHDTRNKYIGLILRLYALYTLTDEYETSQTVSVHFDDLTGNKISEYESFLASDLYKTNINIYDLYKSDNLDVLPNTIHEIAKNILAEESVYISTCLLINEIPNLKIQNYIYPVI